MAISSYTDLQNHLLSKQYTWLITGVAGFIGSHLLEELLKLNQNVVGIDNFSTGNEQNMVQVLDSVNEEQRKRFSFHRGDIGSKKDCTPLFEHIDFVLHQAALGSVPRSITAPDITHENNVTGFLNILLLAKNANVKRFIYASSSSVYGDSPDLPKVEAKIGNPLSPYAVTKLTNELYAKAFSTCYHIETIGLRYFNVFGLRQNPNGPYAAVIPRWISALLAEEPIYINGDGETSRDFCYVTNAVHANLLAALTTKTAALNRVFNVAVGEQHTLNQLYEFIVAGLHKKNAQQPIYREFREGDIRHSLASIEDITLLLGYSPAFTLEEGLKQMLSKIPSRP